MARPVFTAKTVRSVVARAMRRQVVPFYANRTTSARTPGFAQAAEEPARTVAIGVVGDSTGYVQRWVYQFYLQLAALLPTVKVYYWPSRYGDGIDGDPNYAKGRPWYNTPQVSNADAWAAAGGIDAHHVLTGVAGVKMRLDPTPKYRPYGTRGCIGVRVSRMSWAPASNWTMVSQNDSSLTGGAGTRFRVETDGRLALITSPDGTASLDVVRSSVSVSTIPAFAGNNEDLCVFVEFDLDTGTTGAERSYTWWWRRGGPENPATQLGTATTAAGASTWYGHPNVGWVVGDGGSTGAAQCDVYEVVIRSVDRVGPEIVPSQPQQWTMPPSLDGTMVGGRVLHIFNGSWPNHGVQHFTRRTDLGMPGSTVPADAVFDRGFTSATVTATSGNNYSYIQSALPLMPYSLVIINEGHNSVGTDKQLTKLIRRLITLISVRAPEAEIALLVQNPSHRTDGPTGNLTAKRDDHTARMWIFASICNALGVTVLDGRQAPFWDYVRAGLGTLDSLLQTGGTANVHPSGDGPIFQAQAVADQVLGLPYDKDVMA